MFEAFFAGFMLAALLAILIDMALEKGPGGELGDETILEMWRSRNGSLPEHTNK